MSGAPAMVGDDVQITIDVEPIKPPSPAHLLNEKARLMASGLFHEPAEPQEGNLKLAIRVLEPDPPPSVA